MKHKPKLLMLVLGIATLTLAIIVTPAQSRVRPYFSGETINYNDRIYFGTTNTGVLELFKIDNNRIVKINSINSTDLGRPEFLDLAFNQEGSRLYLYLVNGQYLYKYDITDPANFVLTNKTKDNSWDYFYGLSKAEADIVTIGTKGVKIWNHELQVINFYSHVIVKNPASFKFSSAANYLINTDGGQLKVIDALFRDNVLSVALDTIDNHNRRSYNDRTDGAIYVADDQALRKFYLDGETTKFNHISNLGYEVDGLDNKPYVYFSDGIGVVKNRKSDLKPLDWVYTGKLGGGDGWAMGLRNIADLNREYVIVFNGSSILLLNSDLNLLDAFKAHEDNTIAPVGPLFLNLDANWGFVNSEVVLKGGGFGSNEDLKINFAGQTSSVRSNESGGFAKNLVVPNVKPGAYDIKVFGQASGASYSISFTIK